LARTKEEDKMVLARKALDSLWGKADLRGRCWGLKKTGDNPYAKTNITICIGNELVSVSRSQTGDKGLIIHEFVKSKNTGLGEMIGKILREKELLKSGEE
jgi:hypothetical protein